MAHNSKLGRLRQPRLPGLHSETLSRKWTERDLGNGMCACRLYDSHMYLRVCMCIYDESVCLRGDIGLF